MGDEPTRSVRSRVVTIVLSVAVAAFLVATVWSQWSQLDDVDLRLQPQWLIAAGVALLAYQAVQAELALLILVGLGYPVPGGRMRAIFSAGLMARYVPTGALAFVVRVGLAERIGVPRRVALLAMLYEMAFSTIAAAMMLLVYIGRDHVVIALVLLVLSPVAITVAMHSQIFGRIAVRAMRRMGGEDVRETLGTRAVLRLTLVALLSFTFAGLSMLALVHAITDVEAGSTATIFASAGAGFISGMLGFLLPGGLGAREAGLAGSLSVVLPGPIAVAVAIVARLLQTTVELLYAASASAWDRHLRRGAEPESSPSG